jgi:two-component system LytT family response regulator
MEKIRTAIVDDEKPARRALRGLLSKDPEIDIVGEAPDGRPAIELIRELHPQLVFFDVQMPVLSGTDALREIALADRPVVVFVTAYDQYALQAFELYAADYLLKPFSDERFREALARAKWRLRSGPHESTESLLRALLARLKATDETAEQGLRLPSWPKAEPERLVVRSNGQLHFVQQRDIRWIQAQGDYLKLHLKDSNILVRMSMKQMAAELDPGLFARIHRSTIVNIQCVRRVAPIMERNYGAVLEDGIVLSISENHRALLDRFKQSARSFPKTR